MSTMCLLSKKRLLEISAASSLLKVVLFYVHPPPPFASLYLMTDSGDFQNCTVLSVSLCSHLSLLIYYSIICPFSLSSLTPLLLSCHLNIIHPFSLNPSTKNTSTRGSLLPLSSPLTWPESGCEGPRPRCCRRCSRRSRPCCLGRWPERSRRERTTSAPPWCEGWAWPNPRSTACWPHHQQSRFARRRAACRSGCSCPCSDMAQ